jgi:hypothetical protein
VAQREFAVTHPHDNRISIMGTDDVTTGIIIIVRHTGKKNHYVGQISLIKVVQLFVYEALVFHLEVFVVWKRIFSMFY